MGESELTDHRAQYRKCQASKALEIFNGLTNLFDYKPTMNTPQFIAARDVKFRRAVAGSNVASTQHCGYESFPDLFSPFPKCLIVRVF